MEKMRFTRLGLITVLGIFVIVPTIYAVPVQYIKNSKHNLSNWGPGPIKASGTGQRDTEVCIFCHAPHNADSTQAPLWSHADQDASVTFQMASTANVSPNRIGSWADATPTGISKKCLSCHDGTVAIGALANGAVIAVINASGGAGDTLAGERTQGGGLTSGDYGFIGRDLRGGHVISFKYEAFQEAIDSSGTNYKIWDSEITTADKNSMFDRDGKMQCHTCHDPHNDWCNDSNKNVGSDPLWRKACDDGSGTKTGTPNSNATVCVICHKTPKPGPGFQKYSF